MNEVQILIEGAQDVLQAIVKEIESQEIVRALVTMGELKYLLDVIALEHEKATSECSCERKE